jgi:hypothetical protein
MPSIIRRGSLSASLGKQIEKRRDLAIAAIMAFAGDAGSNYRHETRAGQIARTVDGNESRQPEIRKRLRLKYFFLNRNKIVKDRDSKPEATSLKPSFPLHKNGLPAVG